MALLQKHEPMSARGVQRRGSPQSGPGKGCRRHLVRAFSSDQTFGGCALLLCPMASSRCAWTCVRHLEPEAVWGFCMVTLF
jgi:hypothetical protein